MGTMYQEHYAQMPLLRGLSKEQIDQIEPLFQLCQFQQDQTIFHQGQSAQYFYILLDGEVEIRYKPYDGPPLTIARLTPGSVFGWSSVLGRDAYTSAAISVQRSGVYCASHSGLKKMYHKYPETGDILLERLAGVIAARIRSTHNKVLSLLKEGM
jgi:CRP/FNR family transcriptional regulator, cyclic AMP receptor protein